MDPCFRRDDGGGWGESEDGLTSRRRSAATSPTLAVIPASEPGSIPPRLAAGISGTNLPMSRLYGSPPSRG